MRRTVLCLAALLSAACTPAAPSGRTDVVLATTTSVQDSGLLDALTPAFERATGYRLRATAQATAAALKVATTGQADVVLVHEPHQEREFMSAGYGKRRELVMYNHFVLVGPPSDPAGARGADLPASLRRIASAGSTFLSRSDRSGTDVAEKASWARAGIQPSGPWYIESGVGQGQTLVIASERRGYMIVDSGTFTSQKGSLSLEVICDPQPALLNLYHVITIDPARFGGVNARGADAFADYLLSVDGQRAIADHGRARFGNALFVPAAHADEATLPGTLP